jgi:hypothetical protein
LDAIPSVILGPQAKCWWIKELNTLRKDMLKCRRKVCKNQRARSNPLWEQFKEARCKFRSELEKTKKNHWRDWLERAMDPDLWTAQRYITVPPGDCRRTRILDLIYSGKGGQQHASSNRDKSRVLARTFFPDKPPATEATALVKPPSPICKADPISRAQMRRALARLKPFKAPSPDRIPNIVLSKCADIIESRLWYIFTVIFEKGWYYAPWMNFTMVVLQKPGKPKYNIPKAYRPIVLLNTMGKVLTSIITEQLTFYTEKFTLLPLLHFGGRPA